MPIILTDTVPITTDTSNNRPDYEYYRCIGTALVYSVQCSNSISFSL